MLHVVGSAFSEWGFTATEKGDLYVGSPTVVRVSPRRGSEERLKLYIIKRISLLEASLSDRII